MATFRNMLVLLGIFLVFVCISYGYHPMLQNWGIVIALLISGIVGYIAFDFLIQSNRNPNFNWLRSFISHFILTLIFASASFLGNINTLYMLLENNSLLTEELVKTKGDINKLHNDSMLVLIGKDLLERVAAVESLLNRLDAELTSPFNLGSGDRARMVLDDLELHVGKIQRHPTPHTVSVENMKALSARYKTEIMRQLVYRQDFVRNRYADKMQLIDTVEKEVGKLNVRVDKSISNLRTNPERATEEAQQVIEDVASSYSKIYSTVTTLAGKPPNSLPAIVIDSREMASIPHTFQRVINRLEITRTWVYIFIAILIDALPLLIAMATFGGHNNSIQKSRPKFNDI